jgi:hypothetical protein
MTSALDNPFLLLLGILSIHQLHCHLFSKFIPSAPNDSRFSRREARAASEAVGWKCRLGGN